MLHSTVSPSFSCLEDCSSTASIVHLKQSYGTAVKSAYCKTVPTENWQKSVADAKPKRKQNRYGLINANSERQLLPSFVRFRFQDCQRFMHLLCAVTNNRRGSMPGFRFEKQAPKGTEDLRTEAFASGHGSRSSFASDAVTVRDDLLGLIASEERGLRTQKDSVKRASIVRVIDALAELGANMVTTDSSLSGTWRMLWTTEKEQLFIIEKAPLFGTRVGDNLQVIDVARGTLNNIITFPPSGAFVVGSTIEVVSKQRVNFRFQSAVLYSANWRLPLPPFGQGWFETVYLDEKIRVAKDVRDDYLVVDRGPYTAEELLQ